MCGALPAAASGRVQVRRQRGPEPRGGEQEVGRLTDQAAIEQEAWGDIRDLRDELMMVVAAVLDSVVSVAVVGGEVRVGVGGMGVQGRLRSPGPEGGGGVGAEHREGDPRRRAWCSGASGGNRRLGLGYASKPPPK